ncbi:hypothetical protein N2600_26445 (plasmid) [Rhizobium sp. WSM1274]|uniref:hypothetical protein n=1 Tax=Rhizobium sp. WSM1274 TaxID=3138254 RepID=UPI0021A4E9E6|nr:hypothetical protein [Rhizobium leguminosarum]UWU31729.1 hypothetical protein N2600_26445 [Rhizobium leguminosarum bv. viciae]
MLKTIREATVGMATLRLVQTQNGYSGIVFLDGKRKALEEGDDADDVWRRIHDAAARSSPHFFGYDGARARFLHFFPQGFEGDVYSGHERAYKLKAKAKLDEAAPIADAAKGHGFGEAVLSAYRATNLLSPFEKTRLQPVLRSQEADDFVQAAAAFANGDIRRALGAMASVLKRHDSAKWTVVTYLPFLWKPEENVFLKPTMITAFAQRVGHPFAHAYKPELDPAVYESLIDLARTTKEKIADLGPLDMIDVQSFMWTAVEYAEEDKADY